MFENTIVLDLNELDSTSINELLKDQWWLEHEHLLLLKKSIRIATNSDNIQLIVERITDNQNLFKTQLLSAMTKEKESYNAIIKAQKRIADSPEPENDLSDVARLVRYFGCFSDSAQKDTPSTSPAPWDAWVEMNKTTIIKSYEKEFIRFLINTKANLITTFDQAKAEAIFNKLCGTISAEEPSLFKKIASICKAHTLDKVLEALISQFQCFEENIEDKMESLKLFLGPIFASEAILKKHTNAELNIMLEQLSTRIRETPVNNAPSYIKTLLNPSMIDDSQKVGIKWLQNSIKWVIQNREWSDDKAHYDVQLGSRATRAGSINVLNVSYDKQELHYEIEEHRASLGELPPEIQENIIAQLPIGEQASRSLNNPPDVWHVLEITARNQHTYSCEEEEFYFINFNTNFPVTASRMNQVTKSNKNRLVFALDQIQLEVDRYLRNKDEAAVSVTTISSLTPRV